jgi:hypothetical protein
VLGFFDLWATTISAEEERIWLDGKINGKPVRLVFDTGAPRSVLFAKTAERLGLKVTPVTSPVRGGITGMTEECDLTVWSLSSRITFQTLELPAYFGTRKDDGLYGWKQIGSNICRIDAEALTVNLLSRVPEEAAGWAKLPIVEKDFTLSLEIPGQVWTIAVDTGMGCGVALVSKQWHEWKASHTNAPLTLMATYSPKSGLVVCEEAWAKELSLGAFTFTGVPIRQATPMESASGQPIIGMAALRRLDFIFDGKQRIAYLRPKRTPPPAYNHNRLGAEFVPRHSKSDDLIAHVMDGGPAQVAGIRNGDILLKVDDHELTNWRANEHLLREIGTGDPAGTKLDLTMKRGEETLKFSVVLKDILLP